MFQKVDKDIFMQIMNFVNVTIKKDCYRTENEAFRKTFSESWQKQEIRKIYAY